MSGASGTTVEHTYTATGDYTVSVTATDKDGGVSDAATHAITVLVAEVQNGVLVVGGTTGNDAIQVKNGAGDGASLEAIVNGVNLGEFDGLTRAVVYGQAGDDDIDATGSTDLALELYGGPGNDHQGRIMTDLDCGTATTIDRGSVRHPIGGFGVYLCFQSLVDILTGHVPGHRVDGSPAGFAADRRE